MEKNRIRIALALCLLCIPLFTVLPQAQAASPPTLRASLTSPNPQDIGNFGRPVATDGRIVVVGASDEASGGLTYAGNAYIYSRSGSLVKTLTSPNKQSFGHFGGSVATYCGIIVVGAYDEDSGGVSGAGNVYVFTASGQLVTTLTSPHRESAGFFGASVATDGRIIVVGAPLETSGSFGSAGNVYVFTRYGRLVTTLSSPNRQTNGEFGTSVATDGTIIVVSAYYEDSAGFLDAGNAYIFTRFGRLVRTLSSPNPQDGGYFGVSVAADCGIIVVGAFYEDSGGYYDAGNAYVYTRYGNLRATLTSPNTETAGYFGVSVATDGRIIVVGAFGEDTGGVIGAGNVYIYSTSGSLRATLTSPNPQISGDFGLRVATDCGIIVVGAPFESSGVFSEAGNVYVFR